MDVHGWPQGVSLRSVLFGYCIDRAAAGGDCCMYTIAFTHLSYLVTIKNAAAVSRGLAVDRHTYTVL